MSARLQTVHRSKPCQHLPHLRLALTHHTRHLTSAHACVHTKHLLTASATPTQANPTPNLAPHLVAPTFEPHRAPPFNVRPLVTQAAVGCQRAASVMNAPACPSWARNMTSLPHAVHPLLPPPSPLPRLSPACQRAVSAMNAPGCPSWAQTPAPLPSTS